ncbi:hypothetical protein AAG906_012334 [Vitis piasezkii]
MSTSSRTQSLAMGGEDYFVWCESMERQENKELQTQIGHKVLLWQLFKIVQGGIFAESPSTVG